MRSRWFISSILLITASILSLGGLCNPVRLEEGCGPSKQHEPYPTAALSVAVEVDDVEKCNAEMGVTYSVSVREGQVVRLIAKKDSYQICGGPVHTYDGHFVAKDFRWGYTLSS